MALLWMDSFDHYATADIAEKYPSGSGAIQSTGGRRSSGGYRGGNVQGVAVPTLAPASTTAIFGVAVNAVNALGVLGPKIEIRHGVTVQASVSFDNSGYAIAGYGAGTFGTAVSGPIAVGAYYFIEAKVLIHASAGTFVVRVNGVEVLNLTGLNTAFSGSALWTTVVLLGTSFFVDYDDFYVLDGSGAAPLNDFLGDVRVDARYPTAEGASSAWTPLSGTDNALMVDEVAPDDDTTYNSTATVNATDTHVVQDAPVVGAQLYGVQVVLSAKKTDSGTCSLAPVVRHGSTDYAGTAVNPTTSYAYAAVQPYGTNPGTGAAWIEADFNAAQFGYKRTA